MLNLLSRCLAIQLALVSLSLASKEATVVTETGKTHKVNFLRMSNDTIHLWVLKPGGTGFNISGHKSRFRSIEFKDGSWFDFSWSNYDPDARAEGGQLSLPPPELEPPAPAPSDEAGSSNDDAPPSAAPPSAAPPAEPVVRPEAPVPEPAPPASSTSEINAPKWSAEESPPPSAKTRVKLKLAGEEAPSAPRAEKKGHRGRAGGIVLTIGSVGVLAAGGVEFYFANLDRQRALKTQREYLDGTLVRGPAFDEQYAYYKKKTDAARLETTVGSVLAGVGAIGLIFGITLIF